MDLVQEPAAPRNRFTSYTMVLPVYDEESRVARVIEYYRPCAPLLVVDNFSSDRTAEIVRGLGVEMVQVRNAGTIQTPEWFRHLATLIGTDHFVLLSCSEHIPVPLLRRFDEIARARSADVVSCVRKIYTCGEPFPALWGHAPRVERFFDKTGLDYDRIAIHGNFSALRAERLLMLPPEDRYVIAHLRDVDAPSLMKKHTEYAAVEAGHRTERGSRPSFLWLVSALLSEFARLVRVLLAGGNRIALREVWARVVMHTVIYWIGWELKEGRTIEYSRQQSERLWHHLVGSQEK